MIANQAGALWEEIRALEAGSASVATAWLGALAFTHNQHISQMPQRSFAIAPKGYVHIIPKPGGQRNMPPSPEIR